MAKKLSLKQKKALAKGQSLMRRALKIQEKGGVKILPEKKVYKMNLSKALKEAAQETSYDRDFKKNWGITKSKKK